MHSVAAEWEAAMRDQVEANHGVEGKRLSEAFVTALTLGVGVVAVAGWIGLLAWCFSVAVPFR